MEFLNGLISLIMNNPSTSTNIAVAFLTLFLAIATWNMARATQKMAQATQNTLDAQFRPNIIVYIALDKDHFQCINLVIKNIGSAPASNIHFDIPEYFPWAANGIQSGSKNKAKNLIDGPLRNGMKYLAPGAEWSTYWGQFGGLLDSLDVGSVEITAHFAYADGRPAESTKNTLDVRDFESIRWLSGYDDKQTKAQEKQAKALETIERHLQKIVTSMNS